jgi:phosphate:Na+ symporter
MLHTLFNTINTLILVWFIRYIERAVNVIIKTPLNNGQEVFRLKYISAGPLATPELATEQAFDEIIHFANISKNGFGYVKEAVLSGDQKKFEELKGKLVKYEEIADRIEYEIATFLNGVSEGEISAGTSKKIKAMYKIIGELESLGDSGEAISRILGRRNSHNQSFAPETERKLENMIYAVEKAYDAMITNLNAAHKGKLADISNAYDAEYLINNLRNACRDAEIEDIEVSRKDYRASVYYMDIVGELERMGDFIINISQDLEKAYSSK